MKALVFAVMLLSGANNLSAEELVAVAVVFRHGLRAPVGNYTHGKFKEKFPYGPGQLTKEGMQANIKLGKYLEDRYVKGKNFLRSPLLPAEVYFRSKANDPCLMTASAVGSAMFASTVKPAKSAVAVYTQERANEDYMLAHPLNCPYELGRLKKRCNKEADQSLGWPKFEAFVFECLGLHKQSEFFKNPKDFERAEALIVEDKNGLHDNDAEFQRKKNELYDLYQKVYAYNIGVGELEMLKLKQGRLLYAIMELLRLAHETHKAKGKVENNKFSAFSVMTRKSVMLISPLIRWSPIMFTQDATNRRLLDDHHWQYPGFGFEVLASQRHA